MDFLTMAASGSVDVRFSFKKNLPGESSVFRRVHIWPGGVCSGLDRSHFSVHEEKTKTSHRPDGRDILRNGSYSCDCEDKIINRR
jgi:hypothetical protein